MFIYIYIIYIFILEDLETRDFQMAEKKHHHRPYKFDYRKLGGGNFPYSMFNGSTPILSIVKPAWFMFQPCSAKIFHGKLLHFWWFYQHFKVKPPCLMVKPQCLMVNHHFWWLNHFFWWKKHLFWWENPHFSWWNFIFPWWIQQVRATWAMPGAALCVWPSRPMGTGWISRSSASVWQNSKTCVDL